MATIGLSRPYYALYSNTGATVAYSGVDAAGKYTELNMSLEDASDNDFYADNGIAETDPGFSGGSVEITTDDLRPAIAKTILGLQEEAIEQTGLTTQNPKWLNFNDSQTPPFLGFGGILKKKVDGSIKYVAFVFPKIKFRNPAIAATTQGAQIEWQTQKLTADISRSDATGAPWFKMSTLLDTEADAEAVVKTFLGYVAPTQQGGTP